MSTAVTRIERTSKRASEGLLRRVVFNIFHAYHLRFLSISAHRHFHRSHYLVATITRFENFDFGVFLSNSPDFAFCDLISAPSPFSSRSLCTMSYQQQPQRHNPLRPYVSFPLSYSLNKQINSDLDLAPPPTGCTGPILRISDTRIH